METSIIKKEVNENFTWHRSYTFFNKDLYLGQIKFVPTGCGMVTLFNIGNFTKNNLPILKDFIEVLKEHCRKDGIGLVLCTLGDGYIKNEEVLLKLGFEKLKQFVNLKHTPKDSNIIYKQTVYVLEITYE